VGPVGSETFARFLVDFVIQTVTQIAKDRPFAPGSKSRYCRRKLSQAPFLEVPWATFYI
jgi:hypothetical protein